MALLGNVTSGDPIAPSWGNSIRDQTVQVTTSAARPGTPVEGMVIWETDTDRLMVYQGAAWVEVGSFAALATWVPALAQGVTVAKTINQADYQKHGRWVTGQCQLTATANGTAGSVITVSTPVAEKPIAAGTIVVVGQGYINVLTSGQCGVLVCFNASTPGLFSFIRADVGIANFFGTDPSVQVTSAAPFRCGFTFGYASAA